MADNVPTYINGIGTVDVTPTDDGWLAIAKMVASSIVGYAKDDDREKVAALLVSLIEVTGYIGSTRNKAGLESIMDAAMRAK